MRAPHGGSQVSDEMLPAERHAAVLQLAPETPGASFALVPGLGHIEALWRSDRVIPHVLRFLAD